MKSEFSICVDGSRRTIHGEIFGCFGIRKPDPEDRYESGPDYFGAKCTHNMYEVSHLPTGALCGMFKNLSDARKTVEKYNALEGVNIGVFGDGCSLAPGVFEGFVKILTEAVKILGDAAKGY
jgi:hypothetical protein